MTTKIGIVAQEQPDNKFGVNTNYIEWAYQFGRPIILLPETWEDFKEIYKIDALILPGGADVDTKRYSKLPPLGVGNPNLYLEYFDNNVLPNLVGKLPIFGICRGLQTLNVFFGGTLRNLTWHPYSNYETHEVHDVWDSLEANPDKKNYKFRVNSFHHQGIKQIARNLKSELTDFHDNVVEAVSDFNKRIFAVQWHPERLNDKYSYQKFISILR